jgi:hypothetical protein
MTEQSERTNGRRARSDISDSARKTNKDADASASRKTPSVGRKRKRLSAWRRSVAGQTARLEFLITLFISSGLLFAAYFVFLDEVTYYGKPHPKSEAVTAIALAVLGFVGMLVGFFRHAQARIRFQEAAEAKSRKAVDSAINDLGSQPSFQNLLKVNQTQMDQYHDITKHQAADSYRNSQIAMGSGLAIVVLSAIAAIALKNEPSKIILGSIAGVATAFSAYIGATFLNAYRSALNQLNAYFSQPLTASYFLHAERIAATMPREHCNEMRAKIISAMLKGALDDRRRQSRAEPSQPTGSGRNKSAKGSAADGSAHASSAN